jgi:hypothetical protein
MLLTCNIDRTRYCIRKPRLCGLGFPYLGATQPGSERR